MLYALYKKNILYKSYMFPKICASGYLYIGIILG